MLGDSITKAGDGPGGFLSLMQRSFDNLYPEHQLEIINAGISGNKVTDMQARFQTDVLDKKPDLVVINVGINDVWHAFYDSNPETTQVPLPLYRDQLSQMVQEAHSAGISVVLLSPTVIYENLTGPENQVLGKYIGAMGEVATQNHCLYIDLNTPFRHVISTYQKYGGQTQHLLTRDGIHLNLAGNQIVAYTILRGLGVPNSDIQKLRVGI